MNAATLTGTEVWSTCGGAGFDDCATVATFVFDGRRCAMLDNVEGFVAGSPGSVVNCVDRDSESEMSLVFLSMGESAGGAGAGVVESFFGGSSALPRPNRPNILNIARGFGRNHRVWKATKIG